MSFGGHFISESSGVSTKRLVYGFAERSDKLVKLFVAAGETLNGVYTTLHALFPRRSANTQTEHPRVPGFFSQQMDHEGRDRCHYFIASLLHYTWRGVASGH